MKRAALSIVQHGHQYLITDGYESREGLSEVLESFATVLALHLKYRVPLNLHLSGILIEAIAWHAPEFFQWIEALRREGLLELLGSTYAQNVMPLFSDEHNLRQLHEALEGYRRHLGADLRTIKGFWVPERVWSTEKLAPLLRNTALPNGGYAYVLLDDRLAFPLGDGTSSERGRFDAVMPPARGNAPAPPDDRYRLHPYEIEGSGGLSCLPISAELRYAIPPRRDGQWDALRAMTRRVSALGAGALVVYGDDLEKAAAVGPWTKGPHRRDGVEPYEALLAWIRADPSVEPVLLSSFLAEPPPRERRAVEPGTFYELSRSMGAGEDYAAWWCGRAYQPYRELLTEAEALLRQQKDHGPRGGLWDLAWKQLMASSYETAWHDMRPDGTCEPSPWARTLAAHVRSVFVIAAAAEWQTRRDGHAHAERRDIDHDGEEEIILANDWLYAVITPEHGGRLIHLFDLSSKGGRVVVGNSADDWNWQETQNRYMDVPPNHPGAFADVGHEHDHHWIGRMGADEHGAFAELVRSEARGPFGGASKRFFLARDARRLGVSYELPREPERFGIEFALSPDYLALLRAGRSLRPVQSRTARGWRVGSTVVWAHIPDGEPVLWDVPARPSCGHGMRLRVTAYRPTFRLALGVGALPRERP
ncbi:hypothetical protein [Polyangium mundeleinium]|uniref:Glycoside hydrolase family 57 N-terminal domain-containing protein n=1 Tax=Polyangium mundeleinium TaxID=2995306 RepID=A0ABT5EN75_9BACT|nr:hypothetical protein [Polyangium mundeleinium]MDC0742362.1 hypothetical protein [Polyangium mundeleinium]